MAQALAVPDWPNSFGYNMFAFSLFALGGWNFLRAQPSPHRDFCGLFTAVFAACLWPWTRRATKVDGGGVCGRRGAAGCGWRGAGKDPVCLTLARCAGSDRRSGLLYFYRRDDGKLRWLGIAALAAVILQGVLGGLRVVLHQGSDRHFPCPAGPVVLCLHHAAGGNDQPPVSSKNAGRTTNLISTSATGGLRRHRL